ncbi:hypothetical protein, partial [Staphylococcus aureus]|uniref:hypothetical protein n=1 Tax=Staphylococcus aureus TaxID=1280 RepID=UPI001C40ABE7
MVYLAFYIFLLNFISSIEKKLIHIEKINRIYIYNEIKKTKIDEILLGILMVYLAFYIFLLNFISSIEKKLIHIEKIN